MECDEDRVFTFLVPGKMNILRLYQAAYPNQEPNFQYKQTYTPPSVTEKPYWATMTKRAVTFRLKEFDTSNFNPPKAIEVAIAICAMQALIT